MPFIPWARPAAGDKVDSRIDSHKKPNTLTKRKRRGGVGHTHAVTAWRGGLVTVPEVPLGSVRFDSSSPVSRLTTAADYAPINNPAPILPVRHRRSY